MDFKTIVTTIFTQKRNWVEVSDKDKETVFFIFNRYMSKKFPKQAHFFNVKGIDLSVCMDCWFNFLQKEVRLPFWFWQGPTKRKDPPIKDWKLLMEFYKELSLNDIYLICDMFPKECKEEIKHILAIKEEQEK
jgi:hypothetical protein